MPPCKLKPEVVDFLAKKAAGSVYILQLGYLFTYSGKMTVSK